MTKTPQHCTTCARPREEVKLLIKIFHFHICDVCMREAVRALIDGSTVPSEDPDSPSHLPVATLLRLVRGNARITKLDELFEKLIERSHRQPRTPSS